MDKAIVAGDIFDGFDTEKLAIETDGENVEFTIGNVEHGVRIFQADAETLDSIIAHAQHVRDAMKK